MVPDLAKYVNWRRFLANEVLFWQEVFMNTLKRIVRWVWGMRGVWLLLALAAAGAALYWHDPEGMALAIRANSPT